MDFFADLAKQRRKNSWGGFEVSKNDFCAFFSFRPPFSSFSFILSTLYSDARQRNRNLRPSTTQTETQAPHNSRKLSVHSLSTEAARAMQVTRQNEIQRPGVRLHPRACAALGLEAERATPKHLGTPVPRTCMRALGTEYARKSGEPLGFRLKEGTCSSTGAHPPRMTSTSRWRQTPLWVLPGAALLGATSQV